VEEHIKSFHGVTATVLRDITLAAQEFEEHGRALAQAAAAIDVSNRQASEAMAERRQSLDTLVTHLDGKAEDLDHRLMRFAGLLKDTFDASESRAREIGSLIV